MSDAPEGPGWWQASDAKWYPPELHPQYQATTPQQPAVYVQAPPMDRKSAKAAARAAKAAGVGSPSPPVGFPVDKKSAKAAAKAAKIYAKHLRPWYRKKRYWLSIVMIVIVAAIVGGTAAGKKTTNSPTATSTAAASGCLRSHPSYLDEQPKDCVALADDTVSLANTTVTAKWSVGTDATGEKQICAAVSIMNRNNSTISYNDLYWRLQYPSGQVVDTNFAATNDLGSGDIVAGGTASGNVCFADSGASGTYVGIYKPDAFQSNRGIWLFNA